MIYILLVIVIILGIVVMRRPDSFRTERTIHVDVPAASIFPLIEDFHEWRSWSPFEDMDPNLIRTYEGAQRGKGAIYRWKGNSKAGEGRMEITDAPAPSLVRVQQHFTRPFKSESTVEFTLTPEGKGTRVTWAMLGANQTFSKIMGLFINMDALIGKEFEKGLARLKVVAETKPAAGGIGGGSDL